MQLNMSNMSQQQQMQLRQMQGQSMNTNGGTLNLPRTIVSIFLWLAWIAFDRGVLCQMASRAVQ